MVPCILRYIRLKCINWHCTVTYDINVILFKCYFHQFIIVPKCDCWNIITTAVLLYSIIIIINFKWDYICMQLILVNRNQHCIYYILNIHFQFDETSASASILLTFAGYDVLPILPLIMAAMMYCFPQILFVAQIAV